MVTLLLVWGKKKKSHKISNRVWSSRKKATRKRRSLSKQRSCEFNFAERNSAGSSLLSSPVYSEFSSDDLYPITSIRHESERSVYKDPMSSDSVFSVESLKRQREGFQFYNEMSSQDLSAEEVFLYDSLKRRKRNLVNQDSLSATRSREGSFKTRTMSADEALLYGSSRRERAMTHSGVGSRDEAIAEEMMIRRTEKSRAVKGNEMHDPARPYVQRQPMARVVEEIENERNGTVRYHDSKTGTKEQLKQFSDEQLMYESLRRKKEQIRRQYDVAKREEHLYASRDLRQENGHFYEEREKREQYHAGNVAYTGGKMHITENHYFRQTISENSTQNRVCVNKEIGHTGERSPTWQDESWKNAPEYSDFVSGSIVKHRVNI